MLREPEVKALEASRPAKKRAKVPAKPLVAELRELLDAVPAAAAACDAVGHFPDDSPTPSRAQLQPYHRWQRLQARFFRLLGKLCKQTRFTGPELAVLALAQWRLDDGWADARHDIQAALLRGLCGLDPDVGMGSTI